ncbi:5-bromo-4-chloroindolyl phosphate hydrolysis family protein [Tissierella creatinophila]|uniref:5-bromo-4-chloroindolyl phosphate hydrolysis protein n=1 Tax=Tissierella creatinophila DSM 6911 TaxID=1123403 RepID=A0A1U7M350_TISCR|nr:5-bromo-4-chloroindolyl phosphate hydrolysis family protein [Tissierella creatinophila]OLS01639.1 5-bromo-4-chloroindolyl phosphate hydrolysis protein [Tissierella creatinophila DSM 6911]
MKRRDNLNLGDKIKNIVQDSIKNRDFNRLNKNVKEFVEEALEEAKKSIIQKQSSYNKSTNKTVNNYKNINRKSIFKSNSPTDLNTFTIPVGRVSSLLFTIFGTIGSSIFGIAIFVLTLLGGTIGGEGIFYTIALGLFPLFIISIISLINGKRIRKRLKRFQRYISKMEKQDYCSIDELSKATRLSNKAVIRDLRKMIDIGMFPEGHIDEGNTCFMLSNECYEQYLNLQKNLKMENIKKEKTKDINKGDNLNPEIRKAIDEGRKFVVEIKEANIEILGEKISAKLDRLEEITGKIFDYVELHPKKFPEIKKFIEYFLPTTLKLVNAYKKLDSHSIQGENSSSAKKEIEETMDTINLAFENLLDGLFEDIAIDISTDISVLETMFAQEGLTDNDMNIKK